MRRLYPPAGAADAEPAGTPGASAGPGLDTLDGLAEVYAYPASVAGGRAWLRANMVGSLDGAAVADGKSAPLSSPADMRIFGVLRALADVVVVGAETARREGYRPARARKEFAARRAAAGQAAAPAIAVVTRGLDLDFGSPLFRDPVVPTLVLTGAAAPRERLVAARAAGAEVVVAADPAGDGAGVDPLRAVAELAARGLPRLLHEGGPRLLAQFAAAGAVDELCLTVAPLLTGGGAPRIMNGPAVPGPARFAPGSVLEEDGFLFTRYVRA
ncbi:dihydrofolate reductase family protein [Streptomyces sp. NPDC020983]|uniref:dihydrofolate reductase family protein n=1 Tax=Streptomyces sp. NPDC020983 TaxID=3365106 RepID=UPI0037872FB9